jgi:hypothetical protein
MGDGGKEVIFAHSHYIRWHDNHKIFEIPGQMKIRGGKPSESTRSTTVLLKGVLTAKIVNICYL